MHARTFGGSIGIRIDHRIGDNRRAVDRGVTVAQKARGRGPEHRHRPPESVCRFRLKTGATTGMSSEPEGPLWPEASPTGPR